MDCQATLELLESVRPNSNDLLLSEFAEAVTHLESCPKCTEIWSRRSEWNQEIGQAMCRVEVPAALKENLMAVTSNSDLLDLPHTEESSEAATNLELESSQSTSHDIKRRSRRGMMIAATAALVVIGFGVWFSRPTESKLLVEDLLNNAPIDLINDSEFSDDFDPVLPVEWQRRSFLIVDDTAKGWQPHSTSQRDVALFRFYVATPKWATTGVLLVVPASYVEDPPVSGSINNATPHYRSKDGVRYQVKAWTDPETELVYVCFVAGRTNELERLTTMLQRILT